MDKVLETLTAFDSWLWGNWLLFVLLGVGILYTVISGCVQVRHFGYIIRKTLWNPVRYGDRDAESEGSVSSFQALNMALASCVGSGNIVGVATAVLAGAWGHFLDVGSGLCGARHQVRRNYPGNALSGERRQGNLGRRPDVLYPGWAPCPASGTFVCAVYGCADHRREFYSVQYYQRRDGGHIPDLSGGYGVVLTVLIFTVSSRRPETIRPCRSKSSPQSWRGCT